MRKSNRRDVEEGSVSGEAHFPLVNEIYFANAVERIKTELLDPRGIPLKSNKAIAFLESEEGTQAVNALGVAVLHDRGLLLKALYEIKKDDGWTD